MTEIEPIDDDALGEVCEFIQRAFRSERTVAEWRRGFLMDWCPEKPNNGFLLRAGGRLAGVLCAIYSTQLIGGRLERFCNLTSWYVEPEHRTQSLRLLVRVTAQSGYHFTNFTASPTVATILEGLRFRALAAGIIAAPNLPLRIGTGMDLHDRLETMEGVLDPGRRKIARDHADCPGIAQIAAGTEAEGYCHVVYRRGRCRGLPSAVIHDIGGQHLFVRFWPRIARYFLGKGLAATRVRTASLGAHVPPVSFVLSDRQQLYWRSATLGPESISTLYSELMTFGE